MFTDKALYESWGIRPPIPFTLIEWTVDEANKIYLVDFGGRGSYPEDSDYPPTYFLLRYKDLNIFFEGRSKIEVVIEGQRWATNWKVEMTIPSQLQSEIDSILRLIEEALLCQKHAWRDDLIGKIEIRVIVDNVKVESYGEER